MRESRLTVVVPTHELLVSLVRDLGPRFSGGMGAGSDGGVWTVSFYDLPKTAEQEASMRAAIAAWASEVGADDVRITVRLPEPVDPAAVTAGAVTWKIEDGPEDSPPDGSPDDVGPAWVTLYAGDEELSSEQLNDGAWMTRAEATRYASDNGYAFWADD